MARALQDIITELNSVYDPQRQNYNQQIGALDPQQEAEQKGLQAVQQDSFQGITDQANRRGLFYSGLPIQEQQKYTASSFLPAVANLHAKYTNQRFNLQDALAKITEDQYNQAYGVRQKEQELDLQRQLANEAAAREEAARRAAAASSGGGYASPSFGGGGGGGTTPPPAGRAPAPAGGVDKQKAYNAVADLVKSNNGGLIRNTVAAIQASAARGNAYDQYKLQVLASFAPKNSNLQKALQVNAVSAPKGSFGSF